MSSRANVVYGRNAVAEAERGRRRVLRKWTSDDTPAHRLEELAGSPDHQGVVAEVEPYPYADPTRLLNDGGFVVALDEVTDPRNLGAIARSAEVAGAAGLVFPERRSVGVNATVAKTSAGAVEHLSIARVRNLADWLDDAKKQGAWIYGADSGGDSNYTDIDLTGPIVMVLGSEGKGLRPRVRSQCDAVVSIPVNGEVDSLNVSVAAAVLLFEAVRQRAL